MKFHVALLIFTGLVSAQLYGKKVGKGGGGGGTEDRGECEMNSYEKLHAGHGHNINKANVPGAINLPLPGASGCYKGKKIGNS